MMERREYEIELFIFDEELTAIADTNNIAELEVFIGKYPPRVKDVIYQAFLLIQSLKVKEKEISALKVEEDLYTLLMQIDRKRRKSRIFVWAAASVACLAIITSAVFLSKSSVSIQEQTTASLIVDSIATESTDIYIVIGKDRIQIVDDTPIKQTDKGDIVVGEKETIKASNAKDQKLELVVPKGKRTTVTLADGSKIWVNSGTKLIYPKTFAEDKREIYVDGEIYIEVAKDAQRPFYVNSKNLDVAVLGTKFNICAYSEDINQSVVLVEGQVKVALDETKQSKILKPNQGLFYAQNDVVVKNVDAYSYVCWKDNLIKLDNESLDVVFSRLSRHYNIQFHFAQDLDKEKYSGSLKLNESIDSVLESLSFGTSFTYTRKENNIYIMLN